jgi:very-short-patch-repair endonuclease
MFYQHPKCIFWSDKNEKSPDKVALNSHKKFWFNCDCDHEFERKCHDIIQANSWCPYCSTSSKKLCKKEENCKKCFEKSFASVEYSAYWNSKNNISPLEVFKYSHKKYLFDCVCGHTSYMSIYKVSQGCFCAYCSKPPRIMCNEAENCQSCFNKSFASEDKCQYWSDKNILKPVDVFKHSAVKFWFDCNKCSNPFESKLSHVTDGSWCPNCINKTENKMMNILQEYYPLIQCQFKADWCKNKKHLPFDFVIEESKIIIELDGEHHRKQVGKWKTPQHNTMRDVYKMKCANENGYSMIRILQEDVLFNKYDWINELIENINKIMCENIVQNIFMCKKDEYNYLL